MFFFSNLEFSFPRIYFPPSSLRNNGDTHFSNLEFSFPRIIFFPVLRPRPAQ